MNRFFACLGHVSDAARQLDHEMLTLRRMRPLSSLGLGKQSISSWQSVSSLVETSWSPKMLTRLSASMSCCGVSQCTSKLRMTG